MKLNFFKKIKIIILASIPLFSFPLFLFAQQIFKNPIKYKSFAELIYALLIAVIKIGWIFVVVALIYVGFKFVMASGNADKIKEAKRAFLWTVIGGVVLLGSMAISEVICNTASQFTNVDCAFNLSGGGTGSGTTD